METTEINSISDLSQILQTLGEPKKGHTRFFRGHGDEGWQMRPSIYREDYLIENEDKIIKDALTYCPDDFLPSDTLFEKLVKLQHYGYSTRLLDLTTNALVALYFSAWNKQNHEKDGELIILDIPDEQIKYGDGDTASILSAVSLQSKEFNMKLILENIKDVSKIEIAKKSVEDSEIIMKIKDYLPLDAKEIDNNKIFMNLNEISLFIHCFNKQPEIIKLIHDIHVDKPYFRPIIDPSDLLRILCVRAKLNNQRISRQ